MGRLRRQPPAGGRNRDVGHQPGTGPPSARRARAAGSLGLSRRPPGGHRARAALVLRLIGPSAGPALGAPLGGPPFAPPPALWAPPAYSQPAGRGLPVLACEIRALPLRPTVAMASVVEALPAAPA